MGKRIFKSIGFKIIAFYILLSLINISFIISVIFENQVDLISKNTMLESEKQLSQLIGSIKKFTIEIKKGGLFNVKDETETLSQLMKIISMHYSEFIIFTDKNQVIYESPQEATLPETFKEDGIRSLTSKTFSGKDYYLRISDDNKIINFYIPLDEFMRGNSILLVKKNIDSLNESLTSLYKQAIYIVFVVLFFHLLFAAILYKYIIRPLKIFNEAAEKLSNGDLAARVEISGPKDEFYSLSLTFNRMAKSIEENIKSFSTEIKTAKNINRIMNKTEIRDDLTGLLNDIYMTERIEDEIKRSKLMQRDISLILINLDNFSKINEIYGKQTGDIVLLAASKKIIENCSSNDVISRFNGEEFAVLSPEPSMDSIIDLSEKIRISMDSNEVVTADGKFKVTVSIGISYIDARSLSKIINRNDLIASARSALMKAKSSGKNKVEFNS